MIYTQPVFYEFENLAMPVLLMIGDKDTTAIGKALAPPDIRPALGNYPALGKAAAARMPHARLIEFPDLGPRAADTGTRSLPRGLDGRIASRDATVSEAAAQTQAGWTKIARLMIPGQKAHAFHGPGVKAPSLP